MCGFNYKYEDTKKAWQSQAFYVGVMGLKFYLNITGFEGSISPANEVILLPYSREGAFMLDTDVNKSLG